MAHFPYITSISDINLLELLKEIIAAKSDSLHGSPSLPGIIPSLNSSNSLTVHGDYQYQYVSSQFLRHVNSTTGRPLESPSTVSHTCLSCLSALASVSDMSRFTSDDHARLVIRVIRCIAARHPTEAGQFEREQILDFVQAG